MISMEILLVIVVAAVAAYLTRFPGLVLSRYLKVSPAVERGFRYMPIGVFAALIAPSIFYHPTTNGQIEWAFYAAVGVAVMTAWLTRSALWSMLAGVLIIALLRVLF